MYGAKGDTGSTKRIKQNLPAFPGLVDILRKLSVPIPLVVTRLKTLMLMSRP